MLRVPYLAMLGRFLVGLALLLVASAPAHAETHLLGHDVSAMRYSTGRDKYRIKIRAGRNGNPAEFAIPSVQPSVGDTKFVVRRDGGLFTDPLTSGTWSTMGTAAAPRGYRYSNSAADIGEVKGLIVHRKKISAVAKGVGTMPSPTGGSGAIGTLITVGNDSYFTLATAPHAKEVANGRIKSKNQEPPAQFELPRVLVIGLDSGDWDYLDPLMASGHTPTIRDLVASGVKADYDCSLTQPGVACYCPMVWTSIWTGHSSRDHGVSDSWVPPADRKVSAIWNALHTQRPFQESLLLAAHTHVPPIAEATWIIPVDGALGASYEIYDVEPELVPVDPSQWSIPQGLFEELGILPHSGPTASVFRHFALDRVSMEAMKRILSSNGTPTLSAFILHSIDKTMHLWCKSVMSSPDGPVDEPALLAAADAWLGPIEGLPLSWGTAASQYMEADMHVRDLLDLGSWDYVMFTADHGMMLDPSVSSVPCHHIKPQAFDGTFALTGPGVRQGVELGTQNPLCTAPLLGYLMNLRISRTLPCVASGEFESSVLPDIFEPQHLAANPPLFIADW
jgi:hypothetical protein